MKKLWIAYPILVLVMMVVATNFLMWSGQELFVNVQAKQEKAKELEGRINALNRKLTILNKADETKLQDDLKMLLTVVPAKKDVWALLLELNLAASGSGAKVISYKGAAGNVKEATESAMVSASNQEMPVKISVTYAISNFQDITHILKNLQRYLPLNRVVSVEYEKNEATVTIELAWQQWEKVSDQTEAELPQGFEGAVEAVRKQTQQFEEVSTREADVSFRYVPSPF